MLSGVLDSKSEEGGKIDVWGIRAEMVKGFGINCSYRGEAEKVREGRERDRD